MRQTSMWFVLAITLILAGWFTQHQQSAGRIDLGEARIIGALSIRLPAKWEITSGAAPVVLQATERTLDGPSRTISLVRERTSALISPEEYLDRTNIQYIPIDPRRLALKVQPGPIDFAGWPGVLFVGARHLNNTPFDPEDAPHLQIGLFACTVLPSNQAITVSLESSGRIDDADKELLLQVIQSIKIDDEPPLIPATAADLSEGISVPTPARFRLIQSNDPNRHSIRMLSSDLNDWASLELIPCLLPGADAPGILSMLALHDQSWLNGRARQIKPDEWRIEPADGREFSRYALRAYLKTDGKGLALLMIARGEGSEVKTLDQAWTAIVSGMRFTSNRNWEALFNAGADQVGKLRTQGLTALLNDNRDEQWWLWSSDLPEHFLGWSHVRFNDDGAGEPGRTEPWFLSSESRWRSPDRRITGARQNWKTDDHLREWSYEMRRQDAPAALDEALKKTLAQDALLLDPGRLITKLTSGNSVLSSETTRPPANFLSGGWLIALLGRFDDGPMILSTDAMIGLEGILTPRPVLLTIEPSTDQPRTLDGDTQPMRCLSVHVNGMGHVQRWYFKPDGSLQYIALPNHQHREPTAPSQIKIFLNEDPRMVP